MENIRFLNHNVEIIRKPRRRNLTLCMHPDKILSIKVNRQASQKQILDFLISKEKWIENNLNKFKKFEEQFKKPTLSEGALFPFLGELKYFKFIPTPLIKLFFKIEDGFLICHMPDRNGADELKPDEIMIQLKKFYKSEAEQYLKKRLEFWSEITGLVPQKLIFRSNATRWGSCSSQKHISLNWKLVCQSSILIDYVIVHELCHLQYLNHSRDFWNLVETYLPAYATIKNVLNTQGRLSSFLS